MSATNSMYSPFSKDIDNEVLIEEVKARPALYDRSLKEYNDLAYKKQMWEEIYDKLYPATWHRMSETQKELKGNDVVKRWNNLRTCFTRELKIMRDPLTQKRRKYVYFDKLMFLLDENSAQYHEAQELESNFVFNKSNSSLDKSEEETTSFPQKNPAERTKDTETKKTKLKQSKSKDRRKDVEKYVQYTVNKLKEELAFKNRTEDLHTESVGKTFDTDPDANFALSLVPTLKMVPLNKKIDAQIEILSVLKKYTMSSAWEYNIVKYEKENEQTSEADDDSEILSLFNEEN